MDIIIPDRETAKRNGWLFQVQWIEEGKRCFVRCKSTDAADRWADKLKDDVLAEAQVHFSCHAILVMEGLNKLKIGNLRATASVRAEPINLEQELRDILSRAGAQGGSQVEDYAMKGAATIASP